MKKKLTKSNDKVLAGVFGGIAEYFGWDIALTRVIGGILIAVSFGPGIIAYAIAALVMPDADVHHFSADASYEWTDNDRHKNDREDHHDSFDGEFTDPQSKQKHDDQ
ncbi:MAG TPA: PspC domain-containing protein [Lactobacillus sp.]|nr:PspC domain-containing protein [Lactobacillus sp.]